MQGTQGGGSARSSARAVPRSERFGKATELSVSLVAAECQGTEVKASGSSPVPSSFGPPPHAHTPVLSPTPGWGGQRLFLLLSHPSAITVWCWGHPAGTTGHTPAPVRPCVCPTVGSSTCAAPGAAPTPRTSQCGNWSHWATKLPVFVPKTAPPRLPRPLLPLFSASFPRAEGSGPGGDTARLWQGQLRAPQCQPGPGCPRTGHSHAGHAGGLPPSAPQLSPHLQQRG